MRLVTPPEIQSTLSISIKDAGAMPVRLGRVGGFPVSNERTKAVRVAAAISTWLVVGFFAVFTMGGPASADWLEVEPDLFPELTVLTNKFPGVTLINETGFPEKDVLTRSGRLEITGCINNLASTGDKVFGRVDAPPPSFNLIFWRGVPFNPQPRSGILRAEFDLVPALSVEIDAIADDGDEFELQAYDDSGSLIPIDSERVIESGTCANPTRVPLSVTSPNSPTPEISFIYANGVPDQGAGPLDNLRVEFLTLPVFINIKPKDDQNGVNICDQQTLPVAILSFANFFDATDFDPTTVLLEGAGAKRIGKDGEKALHQKRDVNKDGLKDMVVQIVREELVGVGGDTVEMTLTGQRINNDTTRTPFMGKDAVDITQFMCLRSLE